MKACAVIPVYDHGTTVAAIADAVRRHGLHCVLVDDGSEPGCAAVLDRQADIPGTSLVRLGSNQGKGGAMMAGLRAARDLGFSHALQIDADGQHDAADIPAFLGLAAERPEALVCGCPVFDATVPAVRLFGRYATHVWVWINTWSLAIRDSMCGFRVYPLEPTLAIVEAVSLGRRMEFDVEILVRLHWQGVEIVNHPTRVSYHEDGVSHFRLWRDNALISLMHARLFAGMLRRSPRLLRRKLSHGERA